MSTTSLHEICSLSFLKPHIASTLPPSLSPTGLSPSPHTKFIKQYNSTARLTLLPLIRIEIERNLADPTLQNSDGFTALEILLQQPLLTSDQHQCIVYLLPRTFPEVDGDVLVENYNTKTTKTPPLHSTTSSPLQPPSPGIQSTQHIETSAASLLPINKPPEHPYTTTNPLIFICEYPHHIPSRLALVNLLSALPLYQNDTKTLTLALMALLSRKNSNTHTARYFHINRINNQNNKLESPLISSQIPPLPLLETIPSMDRSDTPPLDKVIPLALSNNQNDQNFQNAHQSDFFAQAQNSQNKPQLSFFAQNSIGQQQSTLFGNGDLSTSKIFGISLSSITLPSSIIPSTTTTTVVSIDDTTYGNESSLQQNSPRSSVHSYFYNDDTISQSSYGSAHSANFSSTSSSAQMSSFSATSSRHSLYFSKYDRIPELYLITKYLVNSISAIHLYKSSLQHNPQHSASINSSPIAHLNDLTTIYPLQFFNALSLATQKLLLNTVPSSQTRFSTLLFLIRTIFQLFPLKAQQIKSQSNHALNSAIDTAPKLTILDKMVLKNSFQPYQQTQSILTATNPKDIAVHLKAIRKIILSDEFQPLFDIILKGKTDKNMDDIPIAIGDLSPNMTSISSNPTSANISSQNSTTNQKLKPSPSPILTSISSAFPVPSLPIKLNLGSLDQSSRRTFQSTIYSNLISQLHNHLHLSVDFIIILLTHPWFSRISPQWPIFVIKLYLSTSRPTQISRDFYFYLLTSHFPDHLIHLYSSLPGSIKRPTNKSILQSTQTSTQRLQNNQNNENNTSINPTSLNSKLTSSQRFQLLNLLHPQLESLSTLYPSPLLSKVPIEEGVQTQTHGGKSSKSEKKSMKNKVAILLSKTRTTTSPHIHMVHAARHPSIIPIPFDKYNGTHPLYGPNQVSNELSEFSGQHGKQPVSSSSGILYTPSIHEINQQNPMFALHLANSTLNSPHAAFQHTSSEIPDTRITLRTQQLGHTILFSFEAFQWITTTVHTQFSNPFILPFNPSHISQLDSSLPSYSSDQRSSSINPFFNTKTPFSYDLSDQFEEFDQFNCETNQDHDQDHDQALQNDQNQTNQNSYQSDTNLPDSLQYNVTHQHSHKENITSTAYDPKHIIKRSNRPAIPWVPEIIFPTLFTFFLNSFLPLPFDLHTLLQMSAIDCVDNVKYLPHQVIPTRLNLLHPLQPTLRLHNPPFNQSHPHISSRKSVDNSSNNSSRIKQCSDDCSLLASSQKGSTSPLFSSITNTNDLLFNQAITLPKNCPHNPNELPTQSDIDLQRYSQLLNLSLSSPHTSSSPLNLIPKVLLPYIIGHFVPLPQHSTFTSIKQYQQYNSLQRFHSLSTPFSPPQQNPLIGQNDQNMLTAHNSNDKNISQAHALIHFPILSLIELGNLITPQNQYSTISHIFGLFHILHQPYSFHLNSRYHLFSPISYTSTLFTPYQASFIVPLQSTAIRNYIQMACTDSDLNVPLHPLLCRDNFSSPFFQSLLHAAQPKRTKKSKKIAYPPFTDHIQSLLGTSAISMKRLERLIFLQSFPSAQSIQPSQLTSSILATSSTTPPSSSHLPTSSMSLPRLCTHQSTHHLNPQININTVNPQGLTPLAILSSLLQTFLAAPARRLLQILLFDLNANPFVYGHNGSLLSRKNRFERSHQQAQPLFHELLVDYGCHKTILPFLLQKYPSLALVASSAGLLPIHTLSAIAPFYKHNIPLHSEQSPQISSSLSSLSQKHQNEQQLQQQLQQPLQQQLQQQLQEPTRMDKLVHESSTLSLLLRHTPLSTLLSSIMFHDMGTVLHWFFGNLASMNSLQSSSAQYVSSKHQGRGDNNKMRLNTMISSISNTVRWLKIKHERNFVNLNDMSLRGSDSAFELIEYQFYKQCQQEQQQKQKSTHSTLIVTNSNDPDHHKNTNNITNNTQTLYFTDIQFEPLSIVNIYDFHNEYIGKKVTYDLDEDELSVVQRYNVFIVFNRHVADLFQFTIEHIVDRLYDEQQQQE